ncbi:hypothetical protein M6D81_01340 [Paenibacillus sp. J5C_2022]|uniref:hypothetical protein n=1 Tax=Paenibacillus sp. J5C2022 TaxID=2977129 RepID=UPI0021D1E5E4|nr:hypothetical protein [Paenibacillus sp. J5C2022]MCU6707339.1 hypothetical protein [Paenibacillus sp. J5C2022]
MYAQIFLGVWMLVQGFCHLFKLKFLLRKSFVSALSEEERVSYQKGLVIPYLLSGMIFIGMGIIERSEVFPLPLFLGLYILLTAIPVGLLLFNNKKHSGYYWW